MDLESLKLEKGAHESFEKGACVMEAVAMLAGEKFSDSPACASPVISAFLRRWNDDLDDEGRQKLKRFIPRLIGTNTGKKDDETRAWMCTDWMVRTYLPAWLRLAKLEQQAVAVESVPPIVSSASARSAQPSIDAARSASFAARAAAGDAAWDAAWAAAGDAAWAAAGDAAWDAAGAAAGDAAWDAAWEKLKPTVLSLQESALDLVDRMIAVGGSK